MNYPTSKELFELLKTKLIIPEGVTALTLTIGIDIIPLIQMEYHPEKKENTIAAS